MSSEYLKMEEVKRLRAQLEDAQRQLIEAERKAARAEGQLPIYQSIAAIFFFLFAIALIVLFVQFSM